MGANCHEGALYCTGPKVFSSFFTYVIIKEHMGGLIKRRPFEKNGKKCNSEEKVFTYIGLRLINRAVSPTCQ